MDFSPFKDPIIGEPLVWFSKRWLRKGYNSDCWLAFVLFSFIFWSLDYLISGNWEVANIKLLVICRPEKFNSLLQRLQFIEAHKSTTHSLTSINNILVKLFANVQKVITGDYTLNKHPLLGILIDAGTSNPTSCYSSGTGRAGCWISFDIFMEKSMDGKNLHAISAIEILTGAFCSKSCFWCW